MPKRTYQLDGVWAAVVKLGAPGQSQKGDRQQQQENIHWITQAAVEYGHVIAITAEWPTAAKAFAR